MTIDKSKTIQVPIDNYVALCIKDTTLERIRVICKNGGTIEDVKEQLSVLDQMKG